MTIKLCMRLAVLDVVSVKLKLCDSLNNNHTGEFATGRVIRALAQSWHPDCFKCVVCKVSLADIGFIKHQGRYKEQIRFMCYIGTSLFLQAIMQEV